MVYLYATFLDCKAPYLTLQEKSACQPRLRLEPGHTAWTMFQVIFCNLFAQVFFPFERKYVERR